MIDDDPVLDGDDEILEDDAEPVVVDQRRIDVEQRLYKREVDYEGDQLFRAKLAASTWTPPSFVSSLKEELDLDEDPPEHTLEGLQVKGTNAELVAQFKAGKTTTALNLATSLVDGDLFLGRFEPRKLDGRVAYWNYELSRDQFREWCRRQDIAHPERVVPLNLRDYRMPLSSPVVQDWTIEWLRQHEVEYWILDPWRRVILGSAKENENDEITALTETLDVIKREAGVSDLLVLVHTPRAAMDEGEERARGGSALDDWADVRWVLTRDSRGRYFRANGRDVDVAQFTVGMNGARLDIVGGSRRETTAELNILTVVRAVRESPGVGYKALEGLLPINQNDKGTAISAARQLKWIENRGTKGRHEYHIHEARGGCDQWRRLFDSSRLLATIE